MPGDDLSSAADHHPVHVALHQHVPVSVGHRRRVIIGAVPHQGQRTHPAGRLVAGVVGRGWQRQQRVQVPLHPLADGLGVSPQHGVHPLQAPPLQVGIQRLKTLHRRYRRQEVAPRVAHHPLDIPLVIALAGTTEPVLEQVVGLQLGEGPGALPASVAQYLRHRQLGIVVQNALGRPAQKGEGRHVAVQKGLGGLPGIGLHEAAVVVGQVQHEVVHLALHTGDHRQRLPEIALGVARCMGQRHEHLPDPRPVLPDVVLDYGVLAVEPVLVPQPLEDPLRGVALLSGNSAIGFQDRVNYAGVRLILSLSKGSACAAGSAACSPGASHCPASCAPCPGAGRTPGKPPERSSPPPGRPAAPENTSPRKTSIAPSTV